MLIQTFGKKLVLIMCKLSLNLYKLHYMAYKSTTIHITNGFYFWCFNN